MPCRVCHSASPLFFENGRRFFRCPRCWLIFTDDTPSRDLEEAHYKNQWGLAPPESWDQKADLLLNLIRQYLEPRSILDFGSGCGSLARALERKGVPTTPLEPMIHGFLKDQDYSSPFDAVVSVEVIEHLPDLWSELRQLEKILSPEGVMVFSTLLTNPFIQSPQAVEHFKSWWYKDDPTHVSFFCNRSLSELARLGPYDIDVFSPNVFVIRPQAAAPTL